MFAIFGANSKRRVIDGGRQGERYCTECKQRTPWVECQLKDSFELFFVDVLSTEHRCMVCTLCGEDCLMEDWKEPITQGSKPSPESAVASPPQPRVSAPKQPINVDAEFAALKKRLGK